jgi:hypothetical protein
LVVDIIITIQQQNIKQMAIPPQRTKLFVVGFGTTLALMVYGMGEWLPFHSSLSKQGEESRRQLHLGNKNPKLLTNKVITNNNNHQDFGSTTTTTTTTIKNQDQQPTNSQ